MNNSGEQSRLRAMSLASTGSAYGEEFIGITREEMGIDEVLSVIVSFTLSRVNIFFQTCDLWADIF